MSVLQYMMYGIHYFHKFLVYLLNWVFYFYYEGDKVTLAPIRNELLMKRATELATMIRSKEVSTANQIWKNWHMASKFGKIIGPRPSSSEELTVLLSSTWSVIHA